MSRYLKADHHNSEMVFDPTEPDIGEASFEKKDWCHSVYGNKQEELPLSDPPP